MGLRRKLSRRGKHPVFAKNGIKIGIGRSRRSSHARRFPPSEQNLGNENPRSTLKAQRNDAQGRGLLQCSVVVAGTHDSSSVTATYPYGPPLLVNMTRIFVVVSGVGSVTRL